MSTEASEPACQNFSPVGWRTPNEWVFVAVCQNCGEIASSMLDGGVALSLLHEQHSDPERKPRRYARAGAEAFERMLSELYPGFEHQVVDSIFRALQDRYGSAERQFALATTQAIEALRNG